jgi:hypothetical protein
MEVPVTVPTEEAEASIPMESAINIDDGQNILSFSGNSTTITLPRKAARRTEPWYLTSSPPLRIIPARRRGARITGGPIGCRYPSEEIATS